MTHGGRDANKYTFHVILGKDDTVGCTRYEPAFLVLFVFLLLIQFICSFFSRQQEAAGRALIIKVKCLIAARTGFLETEMKYVTG
jgi:hypothetical protein